MDVVEVITDIAMLWVTFLLAMMLVAALTQVQFRPLDESFRFSFRYELKTEHRVSNREASFIRPLSVEHHPKVRSIKDKSSTDDEPSSINTSR